jgi:malonyl-CoA O-methyltransferase
MSADRKARISAAFGAAAPRYEDAAAPQRFAARLVADLAAQRRPPAHARILELGCGTGILTRLIRARWPGADLIASDLSPDMVAHTAADPFLAATFLPMDGEAPPFEGAWFDLILSNLALQWFDDLDDAIARLVALLRPGGSLIFSTMGAESFATWRAAHHACRLPCGIADYPTLEQLKALIARHGDAFAFDEHVPLDATGSRALITHLRGIGAIVPSEGATPLAPGAMRRVMAAYDLAGGTDSYHIFFARVTRL